MIKKSSIRTIVLLWLAWSLLLIGFQQIVVARMTLQRPDYVLGWTPAETTTERTQSKPTLRDPFLNTQAAWDSEYYLSIAINGYDDPAIQRANTGTADPPSLSYAFMPLYPLFIRIFMLPLSLLGMTKVATATLAGVIVSLLGALAGCIGLYMLARERLGEEGGIRAAFYLLIFPSGFFLAQVYTEGLFIGLVFLSLAFLMKRKWLPAGLLAAASIWVRPGEGLALILPFLVVWLRDRTWKRGWRDGLLPILAVFAPALSYLVWTGTPLAAQFWTVEHSYYGRGLLKLDESLRQWGQGFASIAGTNPQMSVYYSIELTAVVLAVLCIALSFKDHPELALFSLCILGFTITSGSSQGMIRYVLPMPVIYITLACCGKKPAFDRVWMLASILLMSLLTILFSFNFWVA